MLLFILASPLWVVYFFSRFVFSVFELIYFKYKFKILRAESKARFSFYDYSFMTNLSMGIFVSSLVALIISQSVMSVITCTMAMIISLIAMIDYNYKNKYNGKRRKRRALWKR